MAGKRRPITRRGVWSDAYRELLRPRSGAIALASVALFVVAMTIFGPPGTLEVLGPLHRFAYWALCAGITFPLCYAWAAVVLYLTRRRSLIEMLLAAMVAVLFEGLFCTAAVLAADLLFLPARTSPLSPVRTYLTVTIVVAMSTLFVHYGVFLQLSHGRTDAAADRSAPADPPPGGRDATRDTASGSEPAPAGAGGVAPRTTEPDAPISTRASRRSANREPLTASQARFHDLLSRAVSRDIIYLRADDHYVHVHTSDGSCLVRRRFASAVTDLGALGVQVHRSYWVAHRHMRSTVRRDGRTMLRVTGRQEVPISRPYLAAVRAALHAKSNLPAGGEPAA